MARSGVTYEEISLAAETLRSAGENPTIERVRAHLGGRGSNTTISKHLNNWRTNFGQANISPKTILSSMSLATATATNQAILQELQAMRDAINMLLTAQLKIQEKNINLSSELAKANLKLQQASVEIKILKESMSMI